MSNNHIVCYTVSVINLLKIYVRSKKNKNIKPKYYKPEHWKAGQDNM